MENPIILNARLKLKRAAIEENTKKLAELEAKKTTLLRAADDATTEDDLNKAADDADKNDTDIEAIKADVDKLKQEVADIEKKLDDNNEPAAKTDPAPAPTPAQGGARHVITPKKEERAQALLNFIKSQGQKRDGIVTSDLGAIVPKDIIYAPEDEVKTSYDLTKVIDVRPAKAQSGSYTVLAKTDEQFHTAEELVANPELAKPSVRVVDWKVKTRRGQITYSEESLQDIADLKSILSDQLGQISLNTKNAAIAPALATATAKSMSSVDDLKHIFNVDLDPAYDHVIVATQSAYNYLDTLKDNEGRYILHDDITSPSGTTVLGAPITKVPDTAFGGEQGAMQLFVGDAKRFAKLFDRNEVTVDFAIDAQYGRALYGAIRFDVEVADPAAGYFVTVAGTDDPKA
ncbi:phage major capsid protein [Lacticaseibacillus pantheris]|uniref:phage major capsid protein n=1 Tax=Lacticaseibacillus pantheris TaxID=171523 RepID=UPI002657F82B|nr:phage major capsid protein [Lacticaseibacillus pantheris]WKF84483.1 phage major capsid protein [Lacticaseibacillus pantheris]